MKMTRREFLVWLGGTVCLGMLGWLVGRKLQALPEPVPETLYTLIVNKYNWQLLLLHFLYRQQCSS